MTKRRTFTVILKQNLMTALDIEADNALAARDLAEDLYFEPECERIDLGARHLILSDDQWLGNFSVHHVEEAFA